MPAKFKKGDNVMVTAGKDKGRRGEILQILPEKQRVVVQGAGKVKRHKKATANSEAAIVEMERPIHISNISHVDPKDHKIVRVGFKKDKDGKMVRYSKRSNEAIG